MIVACTGHNQDSYIQEAWRCQIDELIVKPLSNLARRISAERIRLEGTDESIRLDKDPVPSEFAEEVREYFQRLGAGEK